MDLLIEPLSAAAFAPFGQVIEVSDMARHFTINAGFAERYHDLARVDVASAGGRPQISIFRARPRSLPMALILLERHPLGSQAFMPLSQLPYLVVVPPRPMRPAQTWPACAALPPGRGRASTMPPAPGTTRCWRCRPSATFWWWIAAALRLTTTATSLRWTAWICGWPQRCRLEGLGPDRVPLALRIR